MNLLWLQLLLSSVVWAEEQYFFLPNATWDDARLHCQACFKELTTITSRNVHLMTQNLSSDHWTGLRKIVNNRSIPWSAWSNGDPVTYQNWYPGHPVPNKVKKLIPVCFSTTQIPSSTFITATSPLTTSSTATVTPTPVTSFNTSTVNSSPVTSTASYSPVSSPVTSLNTPTASYSPASSPETSSATNRSEDMCPILIDILNCLNMTYEELEEAVQNITQAFTPTTAAYSTTTPKVTTHSTTPNATTYSTTTPKVTTYSTTPGTTTFSTTFNATTNGTTTESTTTSNCIFEPEPDLEEYIEDACVVLLSFGMWKEDKCNKSLPFICYEERFFGQISISNVTTSSADLSWTEGPGAENISHYRVELTGDKNQTFNKSDLSTQIQNLTAGTLYNVQVIPVKCRRDLNPQNISFYSRPSGVENLTVASVTTDSAYLTWSKPLINAKCDYYSVHSTDSNVSNTQICKEERCNITGLIPGSEYVFTVTATVNETITGVPSNISEFTIPSRVLDLKSGNNASTDITASWTKPKGRHSSYCYCVKEANESKACNDCNITNCHKTTNEFIVESNLSAGTKYLLCVSVLTKNDSVSGEMEGIFAYTIPNTVTLQLSPNSTAMTANWSIEGCFEKFNASITTDAIATFNYTITTAMTFDFQDLQAGVKYYVTVVTINGDYKSNPATLSEFTRPTAPERVTATAYGEKSIHLNWNAPNESKTAAINYEISYNAKFWNISSTTTTQNISYIFDGLNPGTVYEFAVRVVAGNLLSSAVTARAQTVAKKKTVTLVMLCSSLMPLSCGENATKTGLFNELNKRTAEKLDGIYWKLKWVDRK